MANQEQTNKQKYMRKICWINKLYSVFNDDDPHNLYPKKNTLAIVVFATTAILSNVCIIVLFTEKTIEITVVHMYSTQTKKVIILQVSKAKKVKNKEHKKIIQKMWQ